MDGVLGSPSACIPILTLAPLADRSIYTCLRIHGGAVIVVGGFAGEETRDMQAYDVAGKTWEDWAAHR